VVPCTRRDDCNNLIKFGTSGKKCDKDANQRDKIVHKIYDKINSDYLVQNKELL
jgi:hypothetical protein